MLLDRILADLFDHAGKIVAAVLVVGGLLLWLTMSGGHPVSTLQERCQDRGLPVRVVKLEPGSHEEERFLAMVPGDQRERLPDGHWAFCRANLRMKARGENER
jgi:hypothetical protein